VIEFTNRPGEVRHFVHKRLLRATAGFFTGGPVGAVGGFLAPRPRPAPRRPISAVRPQSLRPVLRAAPAPRRRFSRQGVIPPIKRFFTGPSPAPMAAAGPVGDGCPQGFHPNKSDYMTKSGFVPKHSKCVRNRRRNLSNGRANTRSLRRMAAWDKQERKLGKTLKAIARGR